MVLGAGFSGAAIARSFRDAGHAVAGTTRSADKAAALSSAGIDGHVFDATGPLERATDTFRQALASTTHLVMSIAPESAGDPVLSQLSAPLTAIMPSLQWAAYLSTVGVYGNHDGAWVDEMTPCRPVSRRSVERVEAEDAWRSAADAAQLPLAILRLSGIYGPGRNALATAMAGRGRRLVKPGQVFNRIHVADIAAATLHLAGLAVDGIFNVTDDFPAPPQDVVSFACALAGIAPPPETDFETAELTPMARSFYGENKRVSNAKVKQSGFAFCHPDYEAALTAMWQDGSWRD
jgi:nucleoside-diphosphate-sugar epimerase